MRVWGSMKNSIKNISDKYYILNNYGYLIIWKNNIPIFRFGDNITVNQTATLSYVKNVYKRIGIKEISEEEAISKILELKIENL